MTIREILHNGSIGDRRALFMLDSLFDKRALVKFNIWARYFFPDYFKVKDAPYHKEMDEAVLNAYRGNHVFLNAGHRGCAKTARGKLMLGYLLLNDPSHYRKYIRVSAEDDTNSKQIVTDLYNMLVDPNVSAHYPDTFIKEDKKKREEKMGTFTTAHGVKVEAKTVGQSGRGALQEHARPDFQWYEDFENRKTLRSRTLTRTIWDNMEESRTGEAEGAGAIYTCNYLSEEGNVHKLVERHKDDPDATVMITAILGEDGKPTWPDKYSMEAIEKMRRNDDDFEGERMSNPSAASDVYFERAAVDRQEALTPVKVSGDFKIFKEFNPKHLYASGHDIAEGVGLDSSTTVLIDFTTIPCQVVATYKSNTIGYDAFAYEIERQANMYGGCLVAPECNNVGHGTIAILKGLDVDLYAMSLPDDKVKETKPTRYGWLTGKNKGRMLSDLATAVEDGTILLNDPDLIAECRSYTRNDLIDRTPDPRLATRHYDLLMACAIAYQMRNEKLRSRDEKEYNRRMRLLKRQQNRGKVKNKALR